MATRHNANPPLDAATPIVRCGCDRHASQREHDGIAMEDFVEAATVRALFPKAATRRRFLAAVGSGTAMAAIHQVLPIASMQAMAAETPAQLEKRSLRIGFIPINCATPLIMADPMGFYRGEGLDVSLVKASGWALVRDQVQNGELDASHFLSPMPLAITMGVGSKPHPMRVAAIQNTNGQAITLALKHKDNRDPRNWKGFKFAIPFEYSMHNLLLRYYLAEHGIDPDRDVQLRITPPAEMVANLAAGNIDGFLGPDPFNQRAVYDRAGFIHILSKDIWDGHPCCAFGVSQDFVEQNPNTFAALCRAMLKSAAMARDPANLGAIAQAIAPQKYLNQPETVIRQALTGHYADGLGNVCDEPGRTGFDPMPWAPMATWMLTQMRRWGYIKQDVDYGALAEQVFMLTDARRLMQQLGEPVDPAAAASGYRSFPVMGRTFNPAQPQAYLDSFPIKRT